MQKLTKKKLFIAYSTHGKLVKLNPPGFIYFRYSCTCVCLDMSVGEYACLYHLSLPRCICAVANFLHYIALVGKKYIFSFILIPCDNLILSDLCLLRYILLCFWIVFYIALSFNKNFWASDIQRLLDQWWGFNNE